jgi:hypothetical protein
MAAINLVVENEKLRAENEKLRKELAEKDKLIAELLGELTRLREQFDNLRRYVFGQKSEKHLPQDDVTLSPQDPEANADLKFETITYQRKKRRNKKDKMAGLYIEKIYYDLPEAQRICQCGCGKQLRKIGVEITNQFVLIPERAYIRQHIRFKYGGCQYDSTIITAPMLNQPINKLAITHNFWLVCSHT